jgi:subtilase family serine protease
MRVSRLISSACAALVVAGVVATTGLSAAGAAEAGTPGRSPAMRAACPPAGPWQARCYTLYAPQGLAGSVAPGAAKPVGWGATDIESAYKLPVTKGAGQTVAIVDAFSTPHLASDLAVYRKEYGLPPCTTASGCLRIVNQQGKASPLPPADPFGWGVEETLDVSMVSAACPLCKIIVVEGNEPTFADLAAAENTAAKLGAQVISNSYGTRESGFTQAVAKAYHHPGHTIVASSGDLGYGPANFPANLNTVTSVGGTELAKAANPRGWSEVVWNAPDGASSSGCSAYVAKPAWQKDPHCPGRMIADVSALADNVPIYDSSIPKVDGGPWLTVAGTSAASPIIAGVYALAGNAATVAPGYEYAHASSLFDITKGNNDWFNATHGKACGYDYQCVAKKGYDGPTGLGTPDGTGAF